MRTCVVLRENPGLSETFLRAHLERIEGVAGEVYLGRPLPSLCGVPLLSQRIGPRLARKLGRTVHRRDWSWEIIASFLEAFRRQKPDVVLAEYGHSGVAVMRACEIADVPFVVHFHGFDASHRDVLGQFESSYPQMFAKAAAVIAVSSAMARQLESLGCPRGKLVYNPYGIDCQQFSGADPSSAAPIFVTVGRMVEKKAPYLTLAAFARAAEDCPEARLRMIGDGPLLPVCRDLASGLGDISCC